MMMDLQWSSLVGLVELSCDVMYWTPLPLHTTSERTSVSMAVGRPSCPIIWAFSLAQLYTIMANLSLVSPASWGAYVCWTKNWSWWRVQSEQLHVSVLAIVLL